MVNSSALLQIASHLEQAIKLNIWYLCACASVWDTLQANSLGTSDFEKSICNKCTCKQPACAYWPLVCLEYYFTVMWNNIGQTIIVANSGQFIKIYILFITDSWVSQTLTSVWWWESCSPIKTRYALFRQNLSFYVEQITVYYLMFI